MARVNEQPVAPLESLDSLRRRFLRQNRDIARTNSVQSVRIRNLENEISRLLAENLGLRGDIAQLQNDLQKQQNQAITDNTMAIRSQLESKLLEIGALITNLGEPSPHGSRKDSHAEGRKLRRSPKQMLWRNPGSTDELAEGQNGRLPAILEDKQYPRRTLEQHEIADLVQAAADASGSPDIGPPPVSQFVDPDPVKIDLPARPCSESLVETEGLTIALPANLEQRRRRRESGRPLETNEVPQEVPEKSDGLRSARSGGKRKLSVREDTDEQLRKTITSGRGSADTSRDPTARDPVDETSSTSRTKPDDAATIDSVASQPLKPSQRKVLAPKSINNSPRKPSVTAAKASLNDKPRKHDTSRSAGGDVDIAPRVERVTKLDMGPVAPQVVEIKTEPETPAAFDLFSPLSSQPSTERGASRDTPPPTDIGGASEGQRPSRRARASVNYAQPNLRDKMRRPTKELVDAVNSDKIQNLIIVKAGTNQDDIKVETGQETDWKRLPASIASGPQTSPLGNKAGAAQVEGARGATTRNTDYDLQPLNSASTVRKMLANSAQPTSKTWSNDLAASTHGPEAGNSSSPPVSQRRSIKPSEMTASTKVEPPDMAQRSTTRRRQSSVDFHTSNTAGGASTRRQSSDVQAKGALKRSTSVTDYTAAAALTTRERRTTLADDDHHKPSESMTRRRSMML